ncbi:MAG: GntR family transcriptional regulator [Betaproteobacteria bacterium]|nr:GntR family transcriptional regulator [Betaproteobacteria bacterium]
MEIPTDSIAAQLRERIFRGELSGGFPLRQGRIAEEFGVSRIPVREALNRLEAEGLVVRSHNRGCAVASLSMDDLLESVEIRKALEAAALRHAVPRLTARTSPVPTGFSPATHAPPARTSGPS